MLEMLSEHGMCIGMLAFADFNILFFFRWFLWLLLLVDCLVLFMPINELLLMGAFVKFYSTFTVVGNNAVYHPKKRIIAKWLSSY